MAGYGGEMNNGMGMVDNKEYENIDKGDNNFLYMNIDEENRLAFSRNKGEEKEMI